MFGPSDPREMLKPVLQKKSVVIGMKAALPHMLEFVIENGVIVVADDLSRCCSPVGTALDKSCFTLLATQMSPAPVPGWSKIAHHVALRAVADRTQHVVSAGCERVLSAG